MNNKYLFKLRIYINQFENNYIKCKRKCQAQPKFISGLSTALLQKGKIKKKIEQNNIKKVMLYRRLYNIPLEYLPCRLRQPFYHHYRRNYPKSVRCPWCMVSRRAASQRCPAPCRCHADLNQLMLLHLYQCPPKGEEWTGLYEGKKQLYG